MRVLLAVDASPDAKNAAEILKSFAEPPDLHLLNVVDIGSLKHAYLAPGLPERYFETYRQEVSRLAERVLHETRDELAPHAREVRLIADSGDPAESIIQTAEEVRAELIVLGHRGTTGTSTFLLGGVSQKVATYAPCSVLVVKRPTPALDRILLAVDGSEASHAATQLLATFPFKAPLGITIVTVWSPVQSASPAPSSGLSGSPSAASIMKGTGEDLLRDVAAPFRDGPYTIQTEWLHGDPPFAILEAAGRYGVQMIVVGARGLKGIKRFLLGSVSQKILVHATCSVLIVR